MLPSNFEAHLSLVVNRDYWGIEDIQKAVKEGLLKFRHTLRGIKWTVLSCKVKIVTNH